MAAKRPKRYDVYVDDVNVIHPTRSDNGRFILYKDFLKWEAENARTNAEKNDTAPAPTGRRATPVNRTQGGK